MTIVGLTFFVSSIMSLLASSSFIRRKSSTVISKLYVVSVNPRVSSAYMVSLKMNVLLDDALNAVLCDFGLSRVKSDVTISSLGQCTPSVMGTRNWMAPERLVGGSLKKPCDIYSFGMVVYEVTLAPSSMSHRWSCPRYTLTRRP
jgi:serine/threonine protein kinase